MTLSFTLRAGGVERPLLLVLSDSRHESPTLYGADKPLSLRPAPLLDVVQQVIAAQGAGGGKSSDESYAAQSDDEDLLEECEDFAEEDLSQVCGCAFVEGGGRFDDGKPESVRRGALRDRVWLGMEPAAAAAANPSLGTPHDKARQHRQTRSQTNRWAS